MSNWDQIPGPGQIWVCHACGRTWRTKRSDAGDTSCVLWAVLCIESTIVRNLKGEITYAKAVPDE